MVANEVTCTSGTLAVGEPATMVITGTIDAGFSGTLDNTACASATEAPQSCESETTFVTGQCPLSISVLDPRDPATAGEPLSYTITVTNNGPSTAHDVTMTDV